MFALLCPGPSEWTGLGREYKPGGSCEPGLVLTGLSEAQGISGSLGILGQRSEVGKRDSPLLVFGPSPWPLRASEGLVSCPSSTVSISLQASGSYFPTRRCGQG